MNCKAVLPFQSHSLSYGNRWMAYWWPEELASPFGKESLVKINLTYTTTHLLPRVADMSRKWCKCKTQTTKYLKNGIHYPNFSSTFAVAVLFSQERKWHSPSPVFQFSFTEDLKIKWTPDAPKEHFSMSFLPGLVRKRNQTWANRTETAKADWITL